MLIQVKSRKPISQVAKDLEAAAAKNKFGVMAVHDLKAKMEEKGVSFGRDCLIYEVCNPQQAKRVLEANPGISTALPCRISIYRDGEGVTLATMQPTTMIGLFNSPELRGVAEEVEASMARIMKEAAG